MSVFKHVRPLSLKQAKEAGQTVRFVVQRCPKARGYIVTVWLRLDLNTKDRLRQLPPAVQHGSRIIDIAHRRVKLDYQDDTYTYRTVRLESNKGMGKKEKKRKQTRAALHYRWPLSRHFPSHYHTHSHGQGQKHAVFQDIKTPVEALAKLPRTILSQLKDRFFPNFSVAPSSHESSPASPKGSLAEDGVAPSSGTPRVRSVFLSGPNFSSEVEASAPWKPMKKEPASPPSLYSQLFHPPGEQGLEPRPVIVKKVVKKESSTRKHAKNRRKREYPPDTSIFDLLFPEGNTYLADPTDEYDPFTHTPVDIKTRDFEHFATVQQTSAREGQTEHWILNGTSKCLVASDLQRLVRGKHISDWAGGVKVYQAYNPNTYMPLDQFVLRFRNSADALAFKAAFEAPDTQSSPFFTLAAPTRKRSLSLQKVDDEKPVPAAFDFSGAIRQKLGSNHAVHVYMENGNTKLSFLWQFIREDGLVRGDLSWNIAKGIAPEAGRSVPWGRKAPRLPRRPGIIALAPRSQLGEFNNGNWHEGIEEECLFGDPNEDQSDEWHRDFAIGFDSETEAMSFVRRWHRRHITLGDAQVLLNTRLLVGM